MQVNYKLLLKQAVIISLFVFPITYINYRDIAVPEESVWLINLKLFWGITGLFFLLFFFPSYNRHQKGSLNYFETKYMMKLKLRKVFFFKKDSWVQLGDLSVGFDGLCRQQIQLFPGIARSLLGLMWFDEPSDCKTWHHLVIITTILSQIPKSPKTSHSGSWNIVSHCHSVFCLAATF